MGQGFRLDWGAVKDLHTDNGKETWSLLEKQLEAT